MNWIYSKEKRRLEAQNYFAGNKTYIDLIQQSGSLPFTAHVGSWSQSFDTLGQAKEWAEWLNTDLEMFFSEDVTYAEKLTQELDRHRGLMEKGLA